MLSNDQIRTVPQFLVDSAERWPDQVWCRTPEGEISRADVVHRARRLASGLRVAGVKPGDRVIVAVPNSIEFLVAWFGAIFAEAPVQAVNPRATASELAAVVAALQPSAVLSNADDVHQLGDAVGGSTTLVAVYDIAELEAAGSLKEATSPYVPDVVADPMREMAYLQTSGSTGEPKFIIRNHSMYTLAAEAFPFWTGLIDRDVMYTNLPLAHGNAQLYSVLGSFGLGAKLALLPRFSATTFWDEIHEYGATQFNAIGAMLEILMSQPERETDRTHRVRICYTAPAPSRTRHLEIEDRFNMHLVIGYSQSEAGGFGLIMPLTGPAKYGSMGKPRQHPNFPDITDVRVVNAEGELQGVDQLGELEIRNPTATPGFLNRPEESAALRRPDGWLRTGDLGWLDADGYVFFGGRYKELIRHKGENLSPAEVERVLEEHPAVATAAVVGVPSELSEEDVKGFVVLQATAIATHQELFDWCSERLPHYKRPRYLEFVDVFPETENHKVAKTRLSRERTANEADAEANVTRSSKVPSSTNKADRG